MRLTFDKHTEGDHVTVQTGSVLRWCWHVVRYAVAFAFLLVVIGELAAGHVLDAGLPFLLFALAIPKRRREP